MAIWKSQILITNSPLAMPPADWRDLAGAVVDFWGVVRRSEDEREISGIEYEAHEAMARHQMELIAQRAETNFNLEAIILRHRIGVVAAGEASLFLRVASGHRGAAFAGSQWIVGELKKKVPIWKRPLFVRPESQSAAWRSQQPVPATE
jgi:molybdopterin synthase catalytic subunit